MEQLFSGDMSPLKVWREKYAGTIKGNYFGQSNKIMHILLAGTCPRRKVSVENLLTGQRDCVPAQPRFCRLVTFGGDNGVAAESVLARPTICCSGQQYLVTKYYYQSTGSKHEN